MSSIGDHSRGFTVRLFIPSGNPDGVKIIEKSNWTGLGMVLPRSLYKQEKDRDPLRQGAGVYALFGSEEGDPFPRLYVGEGDPVGPRLDQHYNDDRKSFWTHAVIFTSKDQNLNKAHVQYLESGLVALAQQAKRATLDNRITPQPPSLSEADRSEAEGFLLNMLLCFPVLGYHAFEVLEEATPKVTLLFLKAKNVEGQGYESPGGFVVKNGSQAVKKEAPSLERHLKELRQTLLAREVLVDRGEILELIQDYSFSSPSMAAGVLLGNSANGRTEW